MNFTRIFLLIIFTVSGITVKAQKTLTDSLFHPDSLKYWVNLLADDSLKGRFSGSKESFTAAYAISQEFIRAGIKPLALRNVPAHTITTTSPMDEFYHNLNDEPGTLDYKLMSAALLRQLH